MTNKADLRTTIQGVIDSQFNTPHESLFSGISPFDTKLGNSLLDSGYIRPVFANAVDKGYTDYHELTDGSIKFFESISTLSNLYSSDSLATERNDNVTVVDNGLLLFNLFSNQIGFRVVSELVFSMNFEQEELQEKYGYIGVGGIKKVETSPGTWETRLFRFTIIRFDKELQKFTKILHVIERELVLFESEMATFDWVTLPNLVNYKLYSFSGGEFPMSNCGSLTFVADDIQRFTTIPNTNSTPPESIIDITDSFRTISLRCILNGTNVLDGEYGTETITTTWDSDLKFGFLFRLNTKIDTGQKDSTFKILRHNVRHFGLGVTA